MIRISFNGMEREEIERKPVEIRMWYDRHIRMWTLYPVDAEGNQTDSADYAGHRAEALKIKAFLEKTLGIV